MLLDIHCEFGYANYEMMGCKTHNLPGLIKTAAVDVKNRASNSVAAKGVKLTHKENLQGSVLKRGYIGSYNKMPSKHLQRYFQKFEGRHNLCMADTLDQMELTMRRLRCLDRVKRNNLKSGGRALTS